MKSTQAADNLLAQGLQQLQLPHAQEALWDYLLLLAKWNNAYNLTAIRDLPAMVTRHVLDSLAILPFISGKRIIDVGSGAGLPGIPLAIVQKECHFVLLDSNGKKTRFLEEVKRKLHLDNITIVQSRVEKYRPSQAFSCVTSRAFSDLAQMVGWTEHLLMPDGIWLAMKGRHPDTELSMIHYPYEVHRYQVLGLDDERCAVIIKHVIKE